MRAQIALYIGFIIGNLMHVLMTGYQLVNVNKRFANYSAWLGAFWIPTIVRGVLQLVSFGIFLQNPVLTDWAIKPLQALAGENLNIKLTGLTAFMVGYFADSILSIAMQKYGAKYAWLVAQIPSDGQVAPVPATLSQGVKS